MTDEQIIKALENGLQTEHIKLYLCDRDSNTSVVKATDILKLIRRQQAEIADLEAEIDRQYEQAVADIKGNIADGGTSCHWCIEQNKREAIKKFEERLYAECLKEDIPMPYGYILVNEFALDTIVKEMGGADNGGNKE